MRHELLSVLRCPRCMWTKLDLVVTARDQHEAREGFVFCAHCQSRYALQAGVVDLLADPPVELQHEITGWSKLLGETSSALDAQMLSLPYLPDPHWQGHADNFDGLLDHFSVAGKHVIDLGSGRTWSARLLARRGAHVVATDILRQRYIGLDTAELFLGREGVFFERVLADMARLPFANASFDVAFGSAALHHALDLTAAVGEAARVLCPGGHLLLTSEPVHPDGVQTNLADSTEVQHGINEHIYTTTQWIHTVVEAGLEPQLLLPRQIMRAHTAGCLRQTLVLRPAKDYLPAILSSPVARRMLAWQPILRSVYDDYGLPLVLIARKPTVISPTLRARLPRTINAVVRRTLAATARPDLRVVALTPSELEAAATMGLYPPEGHVFGCPAHWTGPDLQLELTRPARATMIQLLILFPPAERVISFGFDGIGCGSMRSLPSQRWVWRRLDLALPPGIGERFHFELALNLPWSPAEVGRGADSRALGVGIAQLGFVVS